MRHAINKDRASAALPFAAAIFGAGQIQFVAQDPEQRSFRVRLNASALTVDGEIHTRIVSPF